GGVGAVGLQAPQGVQGDEGIVGVAGPKSAQYSQDSSAKHSEARQASGRAEARCTAAIRRRAGLAAAPVLSGTGTATGRPAVVAVSAGGNGTTAYVLAASDCSLLRQLALP